MVTRCLASKDPWKICLGLYVIMETSTMELENSCSHLPSAHFSQKNLQLWLQDVAREHELDNSQGGRVISRFFRIFITISLSYPAAFRLPKTNSEVTRKKCPESVCCEARVANYGRGTTGISRPQWISQKKSGRGWCPDWNCPESVGGKYRPNGWIPTANASANAHWHQNGPRNLHWVSTPEPAENLS